MNLNLGVLMKKNNGSECMKAIYSAFWQTRRDLMNEWWLLTKRNRIVGQL